MFVRVRFPEDGDAGRCQFPLVRIASVALRLSERLVAEHGHDAMGRSSALSEDATHRFSNAMRLAIERQARNVHCLSEPLTETFSREGPSMFGVDDRNMPARCDVEMSLQLRVHGNLNLDLGLTLPKLQIAGFEMVPCQQVNVAAALTKVEI